MGHDGEFRPIDSFNFLSHIATLLSSAHFSIKLAVDWASIRLDLQPGAEGMD